jgi:hydroxyethylthiazole kinase-like uncharacterized protein yjeF
MEMVATSREMQKCDSFAITKCRIPSIVLMENAGRSVADVIEKILGFVPGKSIYILCGKGNNGGDGLVVARHLYNRGAMVRVFLTAARRELHGDPRTNLDALDHPLQGGSRARLRILERVSADGLRRQPRPDLLVDALFGTGFSGAVKGEYARIITWINGSDVPVVAVDIPSGVSADNGKVESIAVRANMTVTMGLRKLGLLVHQGRECAGSLHVADIGIPSSVYERSGIQTWFVQRQDVRKLLPRRPLSAHKHSVGKIFVIAGSRGLTGAAVMSCRSAMRAGAGAVVLGTPRSLLPIVAKRLTEVMPHPLEETVDQTISLKAWKTIDRFVRWCDIVVLGPGLGRNKETDELILELIAAVKKPMLIDADGLNALASNPRVLKSRKADTILTPHAGELSRLTGLTSEEIEANRVEVARQKSKSFNAVLVLKGGPTVTATPKGDVFINGTGNPGMATAGAGDVLSGTIAALYGQHLSAAEAAIAGVFLHGLAGDLAKEKYGEMSLVATDIIGELPHAIAQTRAEERP